MGKGGDWCMVEETIELIRETEANAEAIVKDADERYRIILEEANQKAQRLKTEQRDTVLKEAEAVREAARRSGEDLQRTAASDIENEIKLLKENASKREQEAISLVVSQLV
ncbi:ATPase [Muricomes intestini]|nr:ATPase [Muricomes intestini]